MLEPATAAMGICSSSRTWMAPTWAKPRAPPQERARPNLGGAGALLREGEESTKRWNQDSKAIHGRRILGDERMALRIGVTGLDRPLIKLFKNHACLLPTK